MELTKEQNKPIIRKSEKLKVYSTFIENIQDADLAYIQLLSKFIKGISLLLNNIDIFSTHAWVISLKYKKASQLLTVSKKSKMNLIANQEKYGQIKAENFTADNNIKIYSI